jgi:hypothetical protein
MNGETGKEEAWLLKDLRKTCATYYDAHVPESSIEISGTQLGHHVSPLRASGTIGVQSEYDAAATTAFMALVRGHDCECPCCRRPFADA